MYFRRWYYSICLICVTCCFGYGQTLELPAQLSISQGSIADYLTDIQRNNSVTLSYSINQFDPTDSVYLSGSEMTLEEVLLNVFTNYDLKLFERENNKLLILIEGPKERFDVFISGFIYDVKTGEILPGAIIENVSNGKNTFSNEHGYFSIERTGKKDDFLFRYLGYKDFSIQAHLLENKQRVGLEFNNELNPVIISGKISDKFVPGSGGEYIPKDEPDGTYGFLGQHDIINNAKWIPGVQSGNEGQSGLIVRGGTPDQNLILFEGIPLYEINHTAGISSIFVDESIRSVEFTKSGFPARYGGRLSSVLDIKLKDGDQSGRQTSFTAGVPGVKVHTEGPLLSNQTTYNFSARLSWMNLYLKPIVNRLGAFNSINVSYHDVVGKVTHRFSNTSKLSLSFYSGGDNLGLGKTNLFNEENEFFEVRERNRIEWGSTMMSGNYMQSFGENLFIYAKFGVLNYKYRSRASYNFDLSIDSLMISDERDILSYTDITDVVSGMDIDYYLNEKHRLKAGVGATFHDINPTIKQSQQILEGEANEILNRDSTTTATEYYAYLEDTYTINDHFIIYGGAHYSGYNVRGTRYNSFQPRFRLSTLITQDLIINLSATRMTQYIHLLVNPGIGLPSELWVSSTDNIEPVHATQFSVSLTKLWDSGFRFTMEAYHKKDKNVIEYITPIDVFDTSVNEEDPNINFVNSRDWEKRLSTGVGSSRGIEWLLHKSKGRLKGWISYAYSKTDRTFEDLNGGEPFPFRFDRVHDLNIGSSLKINPRWTIGAHWIYGTGIAFSLPDEGFDSILGIELLGPGERNNYRLPPFHHLDLSADYEFKKSDYSGHLSFGIYNVYNRLNAFYIYTYQNPISGDNIAKKVSLFPFLPYANISFFF